jgi:hypothetical protein
MESPERFEFKFLLSSAQHAHLLAELGRALSPDRQGGPTGIYPVVSLYYDTREKQCYWEAWRKMPSRRKLRVRVYGSADGQIAPTSFIEVKHKVEGRQSGADLPVESRRIVEETQHMVREEGFAPCCTIRYLRHAYWLAVDQLDESVRGHSPLRITMDSGLMVRFENLRPEPDDRGFSIHLLPEGTRVLEIKGNGAIPFALARRLARAGIRASSMSKYCKAIEYLLQQTSPPATPTRILE